MSYEYHHIAIYGISHILVHIVEHLQSKWRITFRQSNDSLNVIEGSKMRSAPQKRTESVDTQDDSVSNLAIAKC